ncbi:MAG: MBL fold metallo-hydrolase [Nitrososphaerales archaeon]
MVSVTFFGTSAAAPSRERGFSCIGIFADRDEHLLLDCGDGAIKNILRFGADVNSISNILISHYHSDHLSGLTQIIETMGIKKRQSDLNLFGPRGLNDYFSTVQKITNVASNRKFRINLNELSPNQRFSAGKNAGATTFEMDHTVATLGYRIELGGKIISFTGDTQPCASLTDLGRDADLFIHEATFLEKDVEKARPPKHSTPREAAGTASTARAKRLVLTHVNDSYENPEQMISEAKHEFSNVAVAQDGLRIDLS